jgi:hypothetical protein
MSRIGAAFTRLLPVAVVMTVMLGAAPVASAQPYPPAPPGWRGPHYYWHGQHWHHRAWAYDRHHHRYVRYW